MKHESTIPTGKNVAGVDVQKMRMENELKPVVDVETIIDAIHRRADHIGPVLEKILKDGHEGAKLN